MTLPFTIIYVHEVRGVSLDVAGLLMGLIAGVALLITAPVGSLIDRLGARVVVVLGNVAQLLGAVGPGVRDDRARPSSSRSSLLGISFGIGWPAYNAMTRDPRQGRLRTQYFGINFALVNLGIGIGGIVSGFLTDVDRPGTFTAIFLADAACVLVPITLLLGPLRRVGRPGPSGARDGHGRPAATWRSCATPPSGGSPC